MTDSLGLWVPLLGRACGLNKHCHGIASACVITVVGLACMGPLCTHVSLHPRVDSVSGMGSECVILFTWVRSLDCAGLGLGSVVFRLFCCTCVSSVLVSVVGLRDALVGPMHGHLCPHCLGFGLA